MFNWCAPGNAVGRPIPRQLRRLLDMLDRVQLLLINDNPWAEPPEPIVRKGIKHIRGYFEDLYSEPCQIQRNGVKIVLVGQEGAGKTRREMVLHPNRVAREICSPLWLLHRSSFLVRNLPYTCLEVSGSSP